VSTVERDHITPPLSDLRIVDMSRWIAGGYCSKLLTDGGADVVRVEPPEGDPLRRWSASGAPIGPGDNGALFRYLHASQRSVLASDGQSIDMLHELLADADAVIWSDGPMAGPPPIVSASELVERYPHLVVVAITPVGLDTSWEGRAVSELTLQAWSGGIVRIARGRPDLPPTFVGGQVGEWMAGAFAGVGLLAALRSGTGQLVDVSILESMAATLTYYPVTFHDQLDRPIRADRFVPTPGVSFARDGIVGLGTGTGQQWLDFCAMVGRPDWQDEPKYFTDRSELAPAINAWVAERTVEELCELATAFRLPNAPVLSGADLADSEHMRERSSYIAEPVGGALHPRPACRFEKVVLREPSPAPSLGDNTAEPVTWLSARRATQRSARSRPFEGLRVLDMTAFWAGPFTGHLLAMLGAEVIHLEAASKPDGARLIGGLPPTTHEYLERGPIFSALNTNKKSLAIDTRMAAGVALLHRVLATCDVLVENFTPRVLEQLGLDSETLNAINPRLITVRMPGFGLDGPWREVSAFAYVIEDASGLTWMSGHPDVPPIEPYSIGDPNAGLHALYGLQLALEHRDRTGEGGLVEAAMLDAALCVTAEQVIEYSAHGVVLHREGNRGPLAAPQNVYRTAGLDDYGFDDCHVAIAVATDEQWAALVRVLDEPEWATDPEFTAVDGRRRHHDIIDTHLAAWCRDRTSDEVVDLLWPAGVPAGPVMQPQRQVELAPMVERGFFEELEHPVIGTSRYATLPIRFSHLDGPIHRQHAPLLGEHTFEVLTDIGLTRDEIATLAADGVVGGASEPT
jgi:crotonobetainyl-CoA:carnitine CoA-transferase CaiB-like acyl-CoA transferase